MGNIVMAQGGIPIQQGMYEQSSTKKAELGRLLPLLDGRCFRYCQCNDSAGITRGHMCSASLVVAEANTVIQTGMTNAISGASIGAKVIKVLLEADTTANLYEDGLLTIEKSTGLGYCYRIRLNKAGGLPVADPCELTLYDPLLVALGETTYLTLTMNKHKDVIVTPSGSVASAAIGVPLIDITAEYYFWAQTKGYAAVYVHTAEAATIGYQVSIGGADGACKAIAAAETHKSWGIAVQIAAGADYATIDLELE